MMKHRIRTVAILVAILAILLAACGPQETETPEPTDAPTEEVVETEEADAESVEATEEMTEEPMDDAEATEEPMDDMEATEEPMDDAEATEEPMDDMEATEEPMDDAEATEEPMDDMEATEEPMDDMGDMAVVSFDDEAGFTFDYPEGYEATASANAITLDMGDQRLIVIPPASYNTVVGGSELEGEEQLAFFVERLGYVANGTADMAMTAASINIELERRGLVGFANLIDLGDDNLAVVLELGPDADSIPSADGAVISSSMAFFVPQAEEISVGDTVAASIEAGNRASYELTLGDGETVNIFLNGIDGLDTYLRVYDADGALIAENDDFSGVSSGLEGFSVDGGGVVTIEVGTFGDSEAGDYELVVEAASMEEPMEEATEEPMDDAEATEEPSDDEASDDDTDAMVEEPTLTIVGLALQTENLDTLATAVVRGGFLSTLNGEGPFTVFAPTDDAFATALETLGLTADELLADQDLLSSVLTYHVVEGAVMSGDLEDGMEVETLNGAILTVGVSDEGVTLTDGTGAEYNVVTADVAASNGVVHIIDGVLLPPSE